MRGVLVFAPSANPTYLPLGLATLSAHVRQAAPECRLEPLDLNLALWDRLAQEDRDARASRDFMQGRAGDFFDPLQYQPALAMWNRAAAQLGKLTTASRAYLERDDLGDDLRRALDFCAALVLRHDPQWVGFSVMYPGQVPFTLALARYLAEEVFGGAAARPPLILGGATASALHPEEVLRACPFLDGVFRGEGEAALVQLLRGNDFAAIAGLSFRRDGAIVTNRKPDTLKPADLTLPDFAGLDPLAYHNPQPVLPVVFSRGCLWRRCRFCAHNLSYSGYRKHAAARFADYLGRLQADLNVHHFYFADQYVAAEDLEELSLAILARGLRLSFHVMGRPTASYTPQRLDLVAQAGCRWISWGVETGSARLLEACGKGTTPAEIRQVIGDAGRAGIFNLLMLIFGLPTSREEDLQATMDLVSDLQGDQAGAVGSVTSSRFQLFEKTPFAAQADRFGLRVTGREVLLERNGQKVHSLRLFHQERASDGSWRPPQGSLEVARWDSFRRWSGLHSPLDDLCCEHTLLHAARRHVVS